MKFCVALTILAVLSAISCVLCQESKVVELTVDSFEETLASGSWVVEFFAPWCQHCQAFASTYNEASLKVTGLQLAKVDCVAQKMLCSQQGIDAYPSFRYTRNGSPLREYTGTKDVEGFIKFAKKINGKSVKLMTASDVNVLVEKEDVVFLALTSKVANYEVFRQVAQWYQDVLLFVSPTTQNTVTPAQEESLKALRTKYAQDDDVVLCIKDDAVLEFDTFDKASLAQWIWTNRYPLVPEIKEGSFHDLTANGKPTFLAAIDVDSRPQRQYVRGFLRDLARTGLKEDFTFAWLTASQWKTFTERIGVRGTPALVVLDAPSRIYWHGPNELARMQDKEAITAWLQDVKAGRIPAQGDGLWRHWVNIRITLGVASFIPPTMFFLVLISLTLVVAVVTGAVYLLFMCSDVSLPPATQLKKD
eukprot:TRINITY_DN7564_c0_g1_i1.p1 TRINITY_DN7564_c0_g1~~TRINITY_DN7564_c0_g1_i1.p1  ORF type:complete len:418 (-),score=80.54 TRINITY_DN7564_c0_g1_i1:77-1330(-)